MKVVLAGTNTVNFGLDDLYNFSNFKNSTITSYDSGK